LDASSYMKPWALLVHAGSIMLERFDRLLQESMAISALDHEFLTQISLAKGDARMVDLANNLWVSKAGVTKVIDRLEERGLVTRSPSPEDRRATVISLTEVGRRTLGESRRRLRAMVREGFADALSEPDLADLSRILEKLLKSQPEWPVLADRLGLAGSGK